MSRKNVTYRRQPLSPVRTMTPAYRLWILDESFRDAHLPFLFCYPRILQYLLAARARVALPRVITCIRCIRAQQIKALHHLFEGIPVREPCSSHSDVLLQTEVLDLVQDGLGVVLARRLVLVGLDRPDVRWLGTHELLDERVGGELDSISSGRGPLLAVGVWPVGEETLQEGVRRGSHEVEQVLVENVFVLVRHSGDVVCDVACVVLDYEFTASRLELLEPHAKRWYEPSSYQGQSEDRLTG